MAKQPAKRKAASPARSKNARSIAPRKLSRSTRPKTPPYELHGAGQDQPGESVLKTRIVDVSVKGEFRPSSRASKPAIRVDVEPDDVLEIELNDGHRVWMRGDEYRERFTAPAARGASDAALPVAFDLQVLPTQLQTRGAVAWAIKSLKVLGVDLAGMSAQKIGRAIEQRASLKRPGLGLHVCTLDTDGFALRPVKSQDFSGADHDLWLLFIHGTFSSTWGSFGDLWSMQRKNELQALREAYPNRVLGFEHETTGVSPFANAIELLQQLPDKARLHVVTHSRGGLVAELLCRGGADRPFEEVPKNHFMSDERYAARGAGSSERELLRDLDALLQRKRIRVEKLVRVACPALGTTLASGRLDRWISVFGSVASLALPETPVADVFSDIGDFIAAVVKERTDPKTLPGLEALMPDSGLIKLLNWPGNAPVEGELSVIAGDIDPDAAWAKLLVWATDRFYAGDHDLIVNTASMYGGCARKGASLASFHKGPSVNHFTYFSNAESAQCLVRALKGDRKGFDTLQALQEQQPAKEIARGAVSTRAALSEVIKTPPRPSVFLLPGIMGSELNVGSLRAWLELVFLASGGLAKLAYGARDVAPIQPVVRYYGDLQLYLQKKQNVIPFAYDWRLPPEQEAERLATRIAQELDKAESVGMPVRIAAHSMGGLIARTMIAKHPDVWQRMCKHSGARLLMLGTPTGGSHAITQLIVGQSETLNGLAKLDVQHKLSDLLGIITRFPGVLAMLPQDTQEDWFSFATWQRYKSRAGGDWVVPLEADLQRARAFRDMFDRAPLDGDRMLYIAGSADATLAAMQIDAQSNQIQFLSTARGDGTVTWDSGIPKDFQPYYMEVEHGSLCAHAPAFPAIEELLETGRTSLLTQTPRVPRSAGELFAAPRAAEALFPSEDVLNAAMIGARPRARRKPAPIDPPIRVRVTHGDLAAARYPVAVGHYQGDGIVSAESALDRALDGELSRRFRLGMYPGELASSALFINPRLRSDGLVTFKGALVVGLGTPTSLSARKLSATFTHALLDYVTAWKQYNAGTPAQPAQDANALGISALLIGTGAGGVNVSDAVYGLLMGVAQANKALAAASESQRILNVEFIEVYEDRAVDAVRAFKAVQTDARLRGTFSFDPMLAKVSGGRRRPSYSEPAGWWHRIEILGGAEGADPSTQPLRFTATTQRARSEVSLVPTQRALVERFVTEAINTTRDNRTVSQTLFQLLLPNDLKDVAPDVSDIVLQLDEAAARYPWEMLQDSADPDREPLVISRGLLRQLQVPAGQYRQVLRDVTQLSALVIGDPVSPFVELKGAQREADEVARRLGSRESMSVTKLVRADGEEIINALLSRPYRILHLAGHGVYKMPRSKLVVQKDGAAANAGANDLVTGMIIGSGIFLTAAEVERMSEVPELVFINCCHLGRIEADPANADKTNVRTDYNLIAANLATQFIRIGVRAVVAAGWEVDDQAALTFSTAFYGRMLAGYRFGKAVKCARREAYENHPGINTWGAYQCYGDPDYRLVHEDVEEDTDGKQSFVSTADAVTRIEDVMARLSVAAREVPKTCIPELNEIRQAAERSERLESGPIRLALARAYADALYLEEAVAHYRWVFEHAPAGMTTKDIEQMVNLMGRVAVRAWCSANARRKTARDLEPYAKTIDEAIAILEWLMRSPSSASNATAGETVERLSLLASLYKRKAWVGIDTEQSLRLMHKKYDDALKLAVARGETDLYPRLNALFAELLLRQADPAAKSKLRLETLSAQITEPLSALDARLQTHKGFWDMAMRSDAQLLKYLLGGAIAPDDLDALIAQYNEACNLASPREFASVCDQIEFLSIMAQRAKHPVSDALRKLAAGIGRTTSEDPGDDTPDAGARSVQFFPGAMNVDENARKLMQETAARPATKTKMLSPAQRKTSQRKRAAR